MKQVWSSVELGEYWTISQIESELLRGRTAKGRLAVAIHLKFYQSYARFPQSRHELAPDVIDYIAEQVDTQDIDDIVNAWSDRTARQYRQAVLKFLAVRAFDDQAESDLKEWLIHTALPTAPNVSRLADLVTEWLLTNRVDRTSTYQIDRIIASARRQHEKQVFARVYDQLNGTTCAKLDNLLEDSDGIIPFARLRTDIGAPSLDSVLKELEKLAELRALKLPSSCLSRR